MSIYSPDKPYTVYCTDCWWSDQWAVGQYGCDIDFSRPFIQQLEALMLKVPRLSSFVSNNQNSDYTNGSAYNKDCYLLFVSDHNETSFYGEGIFNCKNCVDCLDSEHCERCYESVGCTKCYEAQYLINCHTCYDSIFCYDCKECNHCFGCTGLRHKEYYIYNKPYKKEEYEQKVQELYQGKRTEILRVWDTLLKMKITVPHLFMQGTFNEDVSGDNISNCKSSHDIYSSHYLQDCHFIFNGNKAKDCRDGYVVVDNSELSYENVSAIGITQCHFTYCCWEGNQNLLYCDTCQSSHDCFLCIGLKHAQYCILNRQYSKEEYESLVSQIIEKMMKDGGEPQGGPFGEFFPPSLSPFGYNETVAMEYYPLTKEEALAKGFNWSDFEPPPPKVDKILNQEQMKKLPDNIKDIPDDILNWALTCEVSNKPYRIIKQELAFYREHNLPIPRRHPDQRHKDRMALRNPRKLYERTCMKCNKPIQTTYAPDRPEIVYCEECYLKEVY